MKIAAIKERASGENRCAITPETAKLFIKKGLKVCVEANIGESAGYSDAEYMEVGAQVSSVPLEILADADVILKVQPSPLDDNLGEIVLAKPGAIIIGLLSPYQNKQYLLRMLEKNLIGIAMELVPRISKAQNMDVLSSQSNLAGYRAVVEATYYFGRPLPMMMTSAGMIAPAKTLVLGVGVAGLQAIATAKRLGSIVSAYDVRADTKEQVESLGAKFLNSSQSLAQPNNRQDAKGYATENSSIEQKTQEEFLSSVIKNYDLVITTAQIPGRSAPILITKAMINLMKPGSVIVDMSTSTGGNVESSKIDEITIINGIKIIGWSNLPAKIATEASKLYAKNLYNFIDYSLNNNSFNFSDDLLRQMLLTQNGQIVNEKFKGMI